MTEHTNDLSETQTATSGSDTAVSNLVGEDKKYKSVSELERAYSSLLGQRDAILEEKRGVEDQLRRATFKEEVKPSQTEQPKEQTPPAAVDRSVVEEIVTSTIQARTQKEQETNNLTTVEEALVRHYGSKEKGALALNEVAAQNGVTTADLEALARKSPNLVLKLLPEAKKPMNVDVSSADVNTDAADPGAARKSDEERLQELRGRMRKDPNWFNNKSERKEYDDLYIKLYNSR